MDDQAQQPAPSKHDGPRTREHGARWIERGRTRRQDPPQSIPNTILGGVSSPSFLCSPEPVGPRRGGSQGPNTVVEGRTDPDPMTQPTPHGSGNGREAVERAVLCRGSNGRGHMGQRKGRHATIAIETAVCAKRRRCTRAREGGRKRVMLNWCNHPPGIHTTAILLHPERDACFTLVDGPSSTDRRQPRWIPMDK